MSEHTHPDPSTALADDMSAQIGVGPVGKPTDPTPSDKATAQDFENEGGAGPNGPTAIRRAEGEAHEGEGPRPA